jgi:3-oxoadipate enol-lactonase/4-carboxymuconolactone decarboxylase
MASVDVNHVVEGPESAPVLLLIGSIGSNLDIWEPILPELRSRLRVIRYDARGHGRSAVPPGPYSIELLAQDALALLDRYDVRRASLCGTSIGGMVAMWLAAHRPERVDKLALLCTSAYLAPASTWHERAALVRAQGTAAVAKAGVGRWFTPAFAARHPEIIAQCERMVAATPAEGYAACCDAIAAWDGRADLPKITASTWVLAGADDPSTPPSHAYLLGAHIPGARVEVLPSAAHLALTEQPQFVAHHLLEHLAPAAVGGTALSDRERAEQGERVRRAVLGDAHVDAQQRTTPLTAPFQELITRYAWGDIWSRPGLTRAERSIVTLSVLGALGHEKELAMHLRAALRNGLTREQIQEVLLQLAIYAGVPAANRAFAIAQEVLDAKSD